MNLQLRNYQQECINSIPESGSYVIQMATGLGKTVTFSQIPRRGRVLILSHREELVTQPAKYYKDCTFGIEQGKNKAKGYEDIISASVQSIKNRLDKYPADHFDIIITDECHHAAAETYQKIYNHFNPRLHLGFTATPNRSDGMGLDKTFEDIIFERDLIWGIKNEFLAPLDTMRINAGYDLSGVRTRLGDFSQSDLDRVMNVNHICMAIGDAYKIKAQGQVLIFAVSVENAYNIQKYCPDSEVIHAKTKNRKEIIKAFENKEIKGIVNCMVLTEGTDLPIAQTAIIARPTKSDLLYTQMVGRILRPHPEKEKALLIDIVGNTKRVSLCTAPSLLGLDTRGVPRGTIDELEGDIFDLPKLINELSDIPESWIINSEILKTWTSKTKYQTHSVNYFRLPDGSLFLTLKDRKFIKILPEDKLGFTKIITHAGESKKFKMQKALDVVFDTLRNNAQEEVYLWDLNRVKRWKNQPATEKQVKLIERMGFLIPNLNKFEASQILNRRFAK